METVPKAPTESIDLVMQALKCQRGGLGNCRKHGVKGWPCPYAARVAAAAIEGYHAARRNKRAAVEGDAL